MYLRLDHAYRPEPRFRPLPSRAAALGGRPPELVEETRGVDAARSGEGVEPLYDGE